MSEGNLPDIPAAKMIRERLAMIFPDTIPNRNYIVRELAASTVFAFLYTGAVEGTGIYLSPKHVYRMTDEQSLKHSDEERLRYHVLIRKPGAVIPGQSWYSDTTRESIRDETLRDGFVALGVVAVDANIPTTSSKPRYYLKKSFALLFDPSLSEETLTTSIRSWQKENLSPSALAMVAILQSGARSGEEKILVTLPNKETRYLEQGPSSRIAKAVIEDFAPRFLKKPFLIWLSESGNKMGEAEIRMAKKLNLQIDPSRHLPDIIFVDIDAQPIFVFIEVVATDGPMTEGRKEAFYSITDKGGYDRSQVIFITAFRDRQSSAFKKAISIVAWNSYVWFQSEPDNMFILKKGNFTLTSL